MDREILFRGFHPDKNGTQIAVVNGKEYKGDWVEGFYFNMHHNDKRLHIHHFIIPNNTPIPKERPIGEIQVEVIPETVGQFTGLKDINGKEIFDGDILQASPNSDDIGHVYYEDAQWFGARDYLAYAVAYSEAEVIGNIHDKEEE